MREGAMKLYGNNLLTNNQLFQQYSQCVRKKVDTGVFRRYLFRSRIGCIGDFDHLDIISDKLCCCFNYPNFFYIRISLLFLLLIEILKDSLSCATEGHNIWLTINFRDDDSVSIYLLELLGPPQLRHCPS